MSNDKTSEETVKKKKGGKLKLVLFSLVLLGAGGGGFFFFVGRADDMFVCGGENVYPAEVERLLEQHADVAQAAVIAFPDDIKQHIPVAFVVAKPNSTADVTDIKQFTLANGPAYRHPRFIGLLEELPLAGTNKIDRRALFERARSEFSR